MAYPFTVLFGPADSIRPPLSGSGPGCRGRRRTIDTDVDRALPVIILLMNLKLDAITDRWPLTNPFQRRDMQEYLCPTALPGDEAESLLIVPADYFSPVDLLVHRPCPSNLDTATRR